jgi:hypothetical protein
MAATAMQKPAGRILEVFQTSAERQGAYDFLANGEVRHAPMTESLGSATAARCTDESAVYVSIDGSSLSLTDHTGCKGFGGVGSTQQGGRGLKVVTALVVDLAGTPVGVLDQQWWARRVQKKRHDHRRRAVHSATTRGAKLCGVDTLSRNLFTYPKPWSTDPSMSLAMICSSRLAGPFQTATCHAIRSSRAFQSGSGRMPAVLSRTSAGKSRQRLS